MSQYVIKYLEVFREDLLRAVNYIGQTLNNQIAANELVDAVERSILERSMNPAAFEKYHSLKERKFPYYRIYVKNYVVYYVVIPGNPNIMEVRRLLYKRQNRGVLI